MKVCLFVENHDKGGLDTFPVNLVNAWPGLTAFLAAEGRRKCGRCYRAPVMAEAYHRVLNEGSEGRLA